MVTPYDVHLKICNLSVWQRMKIALICAAYGVKIEDLEEAIAEAFNKRIPAIYAIKDLIAEDVAKGLARKKGEIR